MNLIFDWSGTLADDQDLTWQVTSDVLESFGAQRVSRAEYAAEFRLPVTDFYAARCPGVPIEQVDARFFERYTERAAEVRLYRGVPELLAELGRRHRLFVLTTNATQAVVRCLSALGLGRERFDEVCGHAVDKRQHLPSLLERHRLRPQDTLFVGDTVHDVETGRACGVASVAVSYGYTARDRLAAANPDATLDDVASLAEWIAREERLRRPAATVGGLVLDQAQRALLVRTAKWGTGWGTPGGHLEFGEALHTAFAREVFEETGLRLGPARWIHVGEAVLSSELVVPRHYVLISFAARVSDGSSTVTPSAEILEHRWTPMPAALELPLNNPTRALLEHVLARPELLAGL